MPLLNDHSHQSDWVEPDDVPRSVVVYGIQSETFGDFELAPHSHAKNQLLLVQRGAITCEVDGGLWIVPPRSAIWLPGGTVHSMKSTGALEGYGAFVSPDACSSLPRRSSVLAVPPLLRELLMRCARLPLLYQEGRAESRLVAVMLDELSMAAAEDLHLPMPDDARLRRMIRSMLDAPADRGTVSDWADRAGMSARTLERIMRRETGMSFGRWRQQLAIMLAVRWLAGGATIQQVAMDLGYQNAPSFVTMFRKALGAPPGRYMAERRSMEP